jgi:putative aldouronate transport system substrate-binding protein
MSVLQPVDEHIAKYSTDYKAYLAEHPELMPYMVEADGRQYGMTSVRNVQSVLNGCMWIRKDWLDKFGLPVPKTTAEIVNFMRMVRDNDPDGNGVKDTYGVGSDYRLNDFIKMLFGSPWNAHLIVNGHYQDWTATQGYRDYLEFRAMISKEGFLDPEYVTDTNYTRQRQLLVTGKTGLYMQGWAIESEWKELKANVPTAELIPIDMFTTSQGKFGYNREVPYNKMVAMNKDTKNPKAAMALLDWFVRDGYWDLTWGLEGRNYRLVNGVPQVIDADLNKTEIGYLGGTNAEFALVERNADRITLDWLPIQAAQDPLTQEFTRFKMQAASLILQKDYFRMVSRDLTSPDIQTFQSATGSSSQVTAIETEIFMGRASVDDGLRRINDYKKSIGWDAVNAEKDALYQKNKAFYAVN